VANPAWGLEELELIFWEYNSIEGRGEPFTFVVPTQREDNRSAVTGLTYGSISKLVFAAGDNREISSIFKMLHESHLPALRMLELHFSYFLDGQRLFVDDEDPDASLTEGILQQRLPVLPTVYVIIVRGVVATGGYPGGSRVME
jgi:alkylated DNA nucleotide flippase Atl1